MKYSREDADRFWAKVEIKDNLSCWNWKASRTKAGYGKFSLGSGKGRSCVASRVSFEISNNSIIPDNLHVLHTCDNPACVNPNHLFLGTHQDNMKDKVDKGRQPRVDGNAKISLDIAETIRNDLRPYSILVKEYQLCKSTISYIKNNKIWIKENR